MAIEETDKNLVIESGKAVLVFHDDFGYLMLFSEFHQLM